MQVLSRFELFKIPFWSIPPRWILPDQILPNLTLTLTLILTQVGIHRGGIWPGGIFRTTFSTYLTNTHKSCYFAANIYPFKVNSRNTRKRCEICSTLTIKITERCQWRLLFLWLTLKNYQDYFVKMFSIISRIFDSFQH